MEVEPEIANVTVTVQARDRDRRAVLDKLVARNKEVLDLLRGYGEAVEKLESGLVTAYPEVNQKSPGERAKHYAGQARVQVTVRDFTVLGELVAKLADLELVSVAGPWWSLRPDSPVRRQARIAAARDATLRAEEYAEAFGGRWASSSRRRTPACWAGRPPRSPGGPRPRPPPAGSCGPVAAPSLRPPPSTSSRSASRSPRTSTRGSPWSCPGRPRRRRKDRRPER